MSLTRRTTTSPRRFVRLTTPTRALKRSRKQHVQLLGDLRQIAQRGIAEVYFGRREIRTVHADTARERDLVKASHFTKRFDAGIKLDLSRICSTRKTDIGIIGAEEVRRLLSKKDRLFSLNRCSYLARTRFAPTTTLPGMTTSFDTQAFAPRMQPSAIRISFHTFTPGPIYTSSPMRADPPPEGLTPIFTQLFSVHLAPILA